MCSVRHPSLCTVLRPLSALSGMIGGQSKERTENLGDDVDPVIGPAVAKAAVSAADGASKTTQNFLQRALGPTMDVIGTHLAQYTDMRLSNVRRVAEKAEVKKRKYGREGAANPRVTFKVLEEGSYSDDELMAEYFSGLLAASVTPNGRDDLALPWTTIVAGMSTTQVRLHFLLYREWALALHGRPGLELGQMAGQRRARAEVDFMDAITTTAPPSLSSPAGGIRVQVRNFEHALLGLARLDLVSTYSWGPRTETMQPNSQYEALLMVEPSPSGIELFGWALGLSVLGYEDFHMVEVPEIDPPVSRLSSFVLPDLDADELDALT